jgi:hypothetical protein
MKSASVVFFVFLFCSLLSFSMMANLNQIDQYKKTPKEDFPEEGCIWVYPECNYGGNKREICIPNNYRRVSKKPGLRTKSVILGKNTRATVMRSPVDNFPVEIDTNLECYDRKDIFAHLIEVEPAVGCAILFDMPKFSGPRLTVCGQINDLTRNFKWRTSSIKLAKRTQISIFTGTDYSGTSLDFTKTIEDLRKYKIDNAALSAMTRILG